MVKRLLTNILRRNGEKNSFINDEEFNAIINETISLCSIILTKLKKKSLVIDENLKYELKEIYFQFCLNVRTTGEYTGSFEVRDYSLSEIEKILVLSSKLKLYIVDINKKYINNY